jgi:hypothetical protein
MLLQRLTEHGFLSQHRVLGQQEPAEEEGEELLLLLEEGLGEDGRVSKTNIGQMMDIKTVIVKESMNEIDREIRTT